MKSVPPPLRAAPRKSSSFSAMLSSWQVQTAIGIPLFVAAIVVSLFAWREIHVHNPLPRNVVKNADRANAAGSVQKDEQKQAIEATPANGTDSHAGVRDQGHSQDGSAAGIDGELISSAPPSKSSSSGAARALASKKTPKSSGSGIAKVSVAPTPKNGANTGTLSSASKPLGKNNADASQPVLATTTATAVVADSNVQIQIENHFSDAMLKIWIDENLAYAHPLHDGRKKRLLLLGGGNKETLTLPVSSGQHTLRIEVRSAGEQYDETKTVAGEFLTGGERSLSIGFDKHTKEMRVTLANQ